MGDEADYYIDKMMFPDGDIPDEEPDVFCQYCGETALLVSGAIIYPHRPDLKENMFWWCRDCKAWVGCHEQSLEPVGALANAELRLAKSEAHSLFDPLWRKGTLSRSDAYRWLSQQMKLPPRECHIALFNVKQCHEAALHCTKLLFDGLD